MMLTHLLMADLAKQVQGVAGRGSSDVGHFTACSINRKKDDVSHHEIQAEAAL
jgi:hypothetical protein